MGPISPRPPPRRGGSAKDAVPIPSGTALQGMRGLGGEKSLHRPASAGLGVRTPRHRPPRGKEASLSGSLRGFSLVSREGLLLRRGGA